MKIKGIYYREPFDTKTTTPSPQYVRD